MCSLSRLAHSWILISGFFTLFAPQVTSAQVVPDGTFNSQVTVSPNQTQLLITGGSTAKTNLFHSFDRFSIPTGQTAIFAPDAAIANIITRITGKQSSNIDGTIAVQGNANLFLINPNGINFGRTASLAIKGSFFATAASELRFADGSIVSTDKTQPPLLTISVPMGGTQAIAPITNAGNLRVGRDLSIVGGEVSGSGQFSAGNRILISANSLTLDQAKISTGMGGTDLDVRNEIVLRSSQIDSIVDSNLQGGDITVKARSLDLLDGATINTLIRPDAQGRSGNIDLEIQDGLTIRGIAQVPSGMTSVVDGQGIGGTITVNSGSLQMSDGSNILTVLNGMGKAGSIALNVRNIQLQGQSNLPTKIESNVTTAGTGTGGDIRVQAGTLSIANRAQINALTLGQAAGGNVELSARDRITIEGTGGILNWLPVVTSLFWSPNLSIEGNAIKIANQRLLSPKTLITANTTQTGVLLSSFTSFKSGKLSLTSPNITLINQALLATNNWGIGDSEGLNVTASEQLTLSDSFLFASTLFGKGANIAVTTPRFKLNQGVVISGTAQGEGGGNITLNVPDLLLLRFGSQIAARGFNNANSGNININGNLIVAVPIEESNIIANALRGRGGNIQINAQSLLGIEYQPTLTPHSDITASSKYGINGEVKLNVFRSNPGSDLTKLPIEVTDLSDQITPTCSTQSNMNRLSVTGRGGIAPDLAEINRSTPVWVDSRASVQNSEPQETVSDRTLEATGWIQTSAGDIVLVADAPNVLSSQVVCSERKP